MKREIFQKNNSVKLNDDIKRLIADYNYSARQISIITGISNAMVTYYRRRINNTISRSEKDKTAETTARYYARYNHPHPRRKWTKDEDELIMNSELTDRELADMLDRSLRSVGAHRHYLRQCDNNMFNETHSIGEVNPTNENMKRKMRHPNGHYTKTLIKYDYIIENIDKIPIKQIAKNLNVSKGYIYNAVKKLKNEGRLDPDVKYIKNYKRSKKL